MDEEKMDVTLEKGEDVYDIEYVDALVEENERFRELLNKTLFYVSHAEYNLALMLEIEKALEK